MYGPIANGVFNIFKTTRNDFKDFVDVYFDKSKPIIYSEDGELLTGLQVWSHICDHFSKGRDTQIVESRIFGFR